MTVTGADIVLSATHASSTTYRREETLLVGFVSGGEAFTEDTVDAGRRLTRTRAQSGPITDDTLLDRFQRGETFAGSGVRTEYLSSPRAFRREPVSDDASRGLVASLPQPAAGSESSDALSPTDLAVSPTDRARIELITALVERLTGKRITISDPSEFVARQRPAARAETPVPASDKAVSESAGEDSASTGPVFGLRYSSEETYSETETTTFSAQGVIRTADDREISVDVSVTMSRSFSAEISETVEIGAALKDPLVVNFSGTAAALTERSFQFDLDADGSPDRIHFVGPGSGFLANDRNGDGVVNDGSELFGTQSGDGFADLAAYDDDGNGFVDRGDSVFERLRVFVQDHAGNRRLAALGATGVEAIYLGHTSTPFEIRNDRNELQGVVRETGLFVNRNGTAGTVQQIDLVV